MPRKGIITIAGPALRAVELDFAIEHFLNRKQARGCSTNTLRAYGADLADLQGYLAGQGITLLGLIAERHVEAWLDDRAGRKLAPRSIARGLATLRQLTAHALTEAWITHDPTECSRVRFRPKRVIAPEASQIRAVIDRITPIGWQALRDRALLSLAFDGALRAQDLIALQLPGLQPAARHTVDLERSLVHVPDKGGGDGTVGIGETTVKRLREWLTARAQRVAQAPARDDAALFVTQQGTRFTRQALWLLVKRRAAAAGVTLYPHLLRHRRIGDVVETMGLQVGQHVARHRHASTTANVYGAHAAQVLHQRVREAGDALVGRVGA
jgi:site-specific recombinase XerD